MMRTTLDLVREFHDIFGALTNDKPTIPDAETRRLRVALIAEELAELAEASGVEFEYEVGEVGDHVDLVEVADALGDLDYVVQGGNLNYGLPAANIVHEIHRSNMSKIGPDGKPIYREDGKVLKGPHYFRPNIAQYLKG